MLLLKLIPTCSLEALGPGYIGGQEGFGSVLFEWKMPAKMHVFGVCLVTMHVLI